ncbi:hypothetical protein EPN90_02170 [Patescibacteria group bacterium]|nr:MAG: hypothetical protein EPN90_02170 [Patescibacteria group bacterium]
MDEQSGAEPGRSDRVRDRIAFYRRLAEGGYCHREDLAIFRSVFADLVALLALLETLPVRDLQVVLAILSANRERLEKRIRLAAANGEEELVTAVITAARRHLSLERYLFTIRAARQFATGEFRLALVRRYGRELADLIGRSYDRPEDWPFAEMILDCVEDQLHEAKPGDTKPPAP